MAYYIVEYRKVGESGIVTSRFKGETIRDALVKAGSRLFNIPEKMCDVILSYPYNITGFPAGIWQVLMWNKKAKCHWQEGSMEIRKCEEA